MIKKNDVHTNRLTHVPFVIHVQVRVLGDGVEHSLFPAGCRFLPDSSSALGLLGAGRQRHTLPTEVLICSVGDRKYATHSGAIVAAGHRWEGRP